MARAPSDCASCGGTATRGTSLGVSRGGDAGRVPCAACRGSGGGALTAPTASSIGGPESTPATTGISSRTSPSSTSSSSRTSSSSTCSSSGASRGGAATRGSSAGVSRGGGPERTLPASCALRVGSCATSRGGAGGGAELTGCAAPESASSTSESSLRYWPGASPPNIPSAPGSPVRSLPPRPSAGASPRTAGRTVTPS
jgi:hypothetical protein